MRKFNHLHVHTQFSLLDGAAEIGKLYKKAMETCSASKELRKSKNLINTMIESIP